MKSLKDLKENEIVNLEENPELKKALQDLIDCLEGKKESDSDVK